MDFSVIFLVISTTLCLVVSVFFRLLQIRKQTLPQKKSPKCQSHLVAILGSGGHTAEMASLLKQIDPSRYSHRTYVVSSGDDFSCRKAIEIERTIQKPFHPNGPIDAGIWDRHTGFWDIRVVPRARKIHQPLYTTPFSALWCAFECVRVLRSISKSSKAVPRQYPDVIISNGPATSVIFVLTATVLRFLGISPFWKLKSIYVESWARVNSLSLSGNLLLRLGICDRFFVQWETLAKKINGRGVKKVEWKGFLVE